MRAIVEGCRPESSSLCRRGSKKTNRGGAEDAGERGGGEEEFILRIVNPRELEAPEDGILSFSVSAFLRVLRAFHERVEVVNRVR